MNYKNQLIFCLVYLQVSLCLGYIPEVHDDSAKILEKVYYKNDNIKNGLTGGTLLCLSIPCICGAAICAMFCKIKNHNGDEYENDLYGRRDNYNSSSSDEHL